MKFKVGDKVRITNTIVFDKSFVKLGDIAKIVQVDHNLSGEDNYMLDSFSWSRNQTSSARNFELVSQGEPIGYELVKPLPGLAIGTKSERIEDENVVFFYKLGQGSLSIPKKQVEDTTWFKPVYKAKDVVVILSMGRSLKVDKDECTLNSSSEIFKTNLVKELYTKLKAERYGQYTFEVSTFKLGCQEFTKADIELVYKTIEELK